MPSEHTHVEAYTCMPQKHMTTNKKELQEEREDSLLELETLLALFQKWRDTASKKISKDIVELNSIIYQHK